ncbi:hypothetical protein COEREDRAFT_82681 [Coemansia reversa NRRL 1564]|uniref:Uncharacterized protein n=1 Tax=Coemansia reversa (strain ATCC 12441 / NRRL 1564) TaxID=763665 RepID=A0A2G5B6D2_COERN|nr:hypothetical protein COEREDRAFT_82681 [Coemansia reversa NRRL 1564]|eukprot:PIA14552.1 hypothetical protein COEREDRAFT_82681 [Coemansia reversa NRRL 1564]
MSATITLSSSLRPLRLLSSQVEKSAEPTAYNVSSTNNTQLEVNSDSSSRNSSHYETAAEAAAVDTLAQRLWAAGRIGELPDGVSSKLLFDKETLCDDAPYVCVEKVAATQTRQSGAWRKRFEAACVEDGQRPCVEVSGRTLPYTRHTQAAPSLLPQCSSPAPLCSPLIHPQPISNPFRTMMRSSGPPTAPPTSVACHQPRRRERCTSSAFPRPQPSPASLCSTAPPLLTADIPPPPVDPCIHCKRGNFLEFCFTDDRCHCVCHDACPCNPCMEIRRLRPSLTTLAAASHSSASRSHHLPRSSSHYLSDSQSTNPSKTQPITAFGSSLHSVPSSPACPAALLDSAKYPDSTEAHYAVWHQQLPSTAPLLECSDKT